MTDPTPDTAALSARDLDAAVHLEIFGADPIKLYPPQYAGDVAKPYIGCPRYSTTGDGMLLVRDRIQETWLFSRRLAFKDALHRVIARRSGLDDPYTVSWEETLMLVTPRDVCLAALAAVRAEKRESEPHN